ncbi:LysM peptidoglycan-binding domain-containing protein [Carboxylicivirga sp. A043]|uniref:LysM peptidoglycan-binding domain-containing protein n=1 Tax=Carboxylicivirga litoralis TaxID=2816963 RepID=UPI0021CB83CA|nr:LysM peptidoglycan-binding domain-containing protein [Carboxylicivirga sp. A043]MCU4157637.1 LysM peptidoglycan-binding domain-containing protein [Carboxylicivirga sp. A043]
MKHFAIALISLFVYFFTSMSIEVNAQESIPGGTEKTIIDGKEYYLHKVRKGEGLYRISVSYGVSQKEILEVNPSAAYGLKLDQLIKVPVIKGRNSTEAQLNSEEFIYHTVEKGQTAYYIAKRYRVDLQDIYDNNPGSDQQLLVGAMIKVPKKEVRHVNYTVSEDGYYVHKVEPKETLYGIAKKFRLEISDILKYNEGLESGVLTAGSYIRIPVDVVEERAPAPVENLDGTEDALYLYHKIKSGETLYSIADSYNAKHHEVEVANKSIHANDLPIGYILRIPKSSIKKSKEPNAFEDAVLRDHKIRKREHLYDVVEKYDIPSDIIEKVNAAAGIDLTKWEKGMIIKVPTKKWVEQYYESEFQVQLDEPKVDPASILPFDKKECDTYDYSLTKPTLKVALLLPFNVEATRKMNYKNEVVDGEIIEVEKAKRRLSIRSKVFVEFYQGTLLALDKLKKEGVNVDLFVYDTSPDSTKVKTILSKPEMEYIDLIIGPAYSSNLKYVSEFSKKHDIPMVFPLSTVNRQMDNNPLLFQANPSDTLMFDIMARRIIQSSRGNRLVMIRTENEDNEFEQGLSQLIRDKVYWESFKNGEVPDFVEYKFKQDDLASLERMFDKNKENTVLIPSMEEAQVNRIVTTVKGAADKTKANVTLWGLPDWMKYNTINPEDIHKLNGRIFSYYAVDYNDEINDERIKAYRHWFKTEPIAISPFFQTASVQSNMSRYSLWGHDVTYYFITALRDFGPDFPYCIQHHQPHTIQSKLNFLRVSNWGGFYNHGLFVLKFSPDFKLEIEEVQ